MKLDIEVSDAAIEDHIQKFLKSRLLEAVAQEVSPKGGAMELIKEEVRKQVLDRVKTEDVMSKINMDKFYVSVEDYATKAAVKSMQRIIDQTIDTASRAHAPELKKLVRQAYAAATKVVGVALAEEA